MGMPVTKKTPDRTYTASGRTKFLPRKNLVRFRTKPNIGNRLNSNVPGTFQKTRDAPDFFGAKIWCVIPRYFPKTPQLRPGISEMMAQNPGRQPGSAPSGSGSGDTGTVGGSSGETIRAINNQGNSRDQDGI
ncbi:hypothetical protein F6S87_08340 [Bifidobacterium sp. BRDM6]|uniref:Uncharacterized protein n=1 Tax=Bifidobacterium choloepi TaxID=2614131 RepID=A0A6I5N4J8_9BIFI|nr:hypothetical protein [Bifidobacterium choloepi]